jgi:hypothetical protein
VWELGEAGYTKRSDAMQNAASGMVMVWTIEVSACSDLRR